MFFTVKVLVVGVGAVPFPGAVDIDVVDPPRNSVRSMASTKKKKQTLPDLVRKKTLQNLQKTIQNMKKFHYWRTINYITAKKTIT